MEIEEFLKQLSGPTGGAIAGAFISGFVVAQRTTVKEAKARIAVLEKKLDALNVEFRQYLVNSPKKK